MHRHGGVDLGGPGPDAVVDIPRFFESGVLEHFHALGATLAIFTIGVDFIGSVVFVHAFGRGAQGNLDGVQNRASTVFML